MFNYGNEISPPIVYIAQNMGINTPGYTTHVLTFFTYDINKASRGAEHFTGRKFLFGFNSRKILRFANKTSFVGDQAGSLMNLWICRQRII